MGLFDHFPYTNVHELNLDWVLSMMKALEAEWEAFTAGNSLTFADPLQHDISKTYAKNTIVLDNNGDAYVSLQAVPVGVALSNQDYWLMVFDYEAFIEKVNKNFTARYYRGQYRATAAMAIGDWLTVDDVLCKATAAIAADDVLEIGVNIDHFTLEDFIKAFMTSANQMIQQYKNDIDASELLYRQQLAGDIANTTASLQAQLDAAISGATVDSEVINARAAFNDVVYDTLRNSILSDMKTLSDLTYGQMMSNKYVDYRDGTEQASVSYYCTDFIRCDLFDVEVLTYASNDYSGVVFYDSTKTYISGSKAVLINGVRTTLTKPSNAVYVRISCIVTQIKNLEIKFIDIQNTLKTLIATKLSFTNAIVVTGGVGATFDCNSANVNYLYNIVINTLTAATNHVPVDGFMGTIWTIAGANSATDFVQLAIQAASTPAIYYRSKVSGSWSSWEKVPRSGDYIKPSQGLTVAGGVTNTYDFNYANVGYILNATAGGFTKATNHVPFDGFAGSIWTIAGANSATDTYIQLAAVATASPALWIRVKQYGGTWTDWYRLSLTAELAANIRTVSEQAKVYNILKAFDNITCCGDSLTTCYVYTGVGTYRIAHKTYPQMLAEYTGATVSALANGGLSASDWWTAYESSIVSKNNQLAIIYLGTNQGLTDTLSTDAPSADPYNTWANTNTGDYAKIIAKYQSVGAKVLLVKVYASSGDVITTNDVIEQCATRFGCGIVENEGFNKFSFHAYPDLSGDGGVHYNDLGYAAFTNQLIQNVGLMDSNFQKYIIPN